MNTKLRKERELFGATHTQLGALLLGFWNVDEAVAEAVGFYATPADAASRGFSPVAAVHGATVLLRRAGLAWDFDYLKEMGLADRVGKWSQLDELHSLLSAAG